VPHPERSEGWEEKMNAHTDLVNPELDRLAAMTEEDFRRAFKGSPVKRTKYSGWRRNLAVAMGNSNRREFAQRLEDWSRDADPNLAEHARWALQRLESSPDEAASLDPSK